MNSSDDLSRFKFLLDGFLSDTLNEADARAFWEAIGSSKCDELLLNKMEDEYQRSSELLKKYKYAIGNEYSIAGKGKKKFALSDRPVKKLMIAACSFMLLSYPIYYFLFEKHIPGIHNTSNTLAAYFNV